MKGTLALAALVVVLNFAQAQDDLTAYLGGDEFVYGSFTDDFIWGVSSAAFSVEGAYMEGGREPSIWDVFSTKPGAIDDGSNGQVACDSYHKYTEDVQAASTIGVSHYSFSISWSRVMPDGVTSNPEGVDYYNNLLTELEVNNIKPIVTLYYWDLPQALERKGGWLNPDIINYFRDYADFCYSEFGDRVGIWITLNDPWSVATKGYGTGEHAPGSYDPAINVYLAGYHLIKAHVAAYKVYDGTYRASQNGEVGIGLRSDIQMGGDLMDFDTLYAAFIAREFQIGWFAAPLFLDIADYPERMVNATRDKSYAQGYSKSRLPAFTDAEKDENRYSADFLGLIYYTPWRTIPDPKPLFPPSYDSDQDVLNYPDPAWEATATEDVYIYAVGIGEALRWLIQGYNNARVLLLENGVSDNHGSLADQDRIDYLRDHINFVLKLQKDEGSNVFGYVANSLTDSWTGTGGYTLKYGLHGINFSDPDLGREPKASAMYYASVIADNGFKKGYSGIGGQAVGEIERPDSQDIMYGQFPSDYIWSAGSAAYMVEGAWNIEGKGDSIWDTWANENKINFGETGNTATNSYEQYGDDVQMLANMGATHYTFSISWPRVLPTGNEADGINDAGVQYYHNLIDALIYNNIQPVVILYYWDLPQVLQGNDGWLDPNTRARFSDYARLCFNEYGSKVKKWITIADPETIAYSGYGDGSMPPGNVNTADGQYQAAHQLLLAHAEVYEIYDTEFRAAQGGTIGISVKVTWANPRDPLSAGDLLAAERYMTFTAGWFLQPIIGEGDYPEEMKETAGTRLPEFDATEVEQIKGSVDFIGVLYPNPTTVYASGASGDNYLSDRGTATDTSATSDPDDIALGLRKTVTWVQNRYPGFPLYVSSGVQDTNGTVDDWYRVHALRLSQNQLLKAITLDGVNVEGFNYWTLLDGFMFSDGWTVRSGLISVDRNDAALPRIQKTSAFWYRTLIADGGFKEGYTQPGNWGTYVDLENEFVYGTLSEDFYFGVATTAYNVEGGWDQDGKGPSIWDTFTQTGNINNGETGNIAADSYNKLDEDLRIIKDLGVDHYRFSISWSRILPSGTGDVNEAGIDYYNRLINGLQDMGVAPVVQMYGFDLPQALQDQGGWDNSEIQNWFADYSDILFSNFGDRVKLWITISEPWAISILGHGFAVQAPGLMDSNELIYRVSHNLILAHAQAYRTYQDNCRDTQGGHVGMALHCDNYEPESMSSDEAIEAARRAQMFYIGWFAEPIFLTGDYPEVMKTSVGDRLPVFTADEQELVRNSSDFFGIVHYTSSIVKPGAAAPSGFYFDSGVTTYQDEDWLSSGSSWLQSYPQGFRKVLNFVYREYGKPVLVNANGISDRNASIDDDFRVGYFRDYIDEMMKAITIDNIDVIGYTARTLIDGFEWQEGTQEKWGLYNVDFTDEDRTRTPKASSRYLYELYRDNGFIEGAFTDPNRQTVLAYADGFDYAGNFPTGFNLGVSSTTISADLSQKDCPNAEADSEDFDTSLLDFTQGDINAIHNIKPNHYMFTLSWRRLMPNGTAGGVNKKAVDYYHTALDLLKEERVEPMVALHQWDYPCAVDDGWMNDDVVEEFVAYAKAAFENFGDKVKMWLTIDQANQVPFYVPSLVINDPRMYKIYRNVIVAHAQVYRMYDTEFRSLQGGVVGITIHPLMSRAINANDPNHANSEYLSNEFTFGLAGDPVFKGGDFSQTVYDSAGSNLEPLTADETQMINGSADFLGVAFYMIMPVGTDANPEDQKSLYAAFYPDAASVNSLDLRTFLRFTGSRYPNTPIYVTEMGGWTNSDSLQDTDRVNFLTNQLNDVINAVVVDGFDVRGFTYRSAMDNFVWEYQYERRYGLYNYPSYEARDSAANYAKIIRENGVFRTDGTSEGGSEDGSCPTEECDCSALGGSPRLLKAAPLALLMVAFHGLYRALGAVRSL